jgi:serine/threonine protein kinase
MVGSKVQHYQFLEKLGAGGMGEIYRAQDTRLNRFVAVKVLSGSNTGDPDRRRRFIQEAQAASALNHPNIITIHDILTDSDAQFMVMEHVQGKTLSDLIPKGGLRVPQVLKLAMQMTDALQTAHAAGIVHRDLKPGNVMVTDTGLVKILDFGLAKLTDPSPITQDDATRTIAEGPLTVEGSIIGTVSYMSPEQAQGMKVDTRSDIFSLGVVLYEMITGMRAFHGETSVATLTAILRDDPKPILEVAPDVPPRLAQMVDRCLQKSPDDRFQTMRDVHLALGGLKHESDSGVLYRSMVATQADLLLPSTRKAKPPSSGPQPASNAKSSNSKGLLIAAAAVVVIGVGVFLWMKTRPEAPAPEPVNQVEVAAPPAVPPSPADPTLTNEQIIQLWAAKVPLDVILSQIRNTPNKFDLSSEGLIKLTQAGVPSPVIEAMRDPKSSQAKPVATAKAVTLGSTPPAPPKAPEKAVVPTPQESTPAPAPPPVRTATPPPPPADVVGVRPPAPVQSPVPAPTHQVVLADGTPFLVVLGMDIPDNAKAGMLLHFTAGTDVKSGDYIAIPKGAVATGEIAQGKRAFGKMTLRMTAVTAVDGKSYSIRAISSRKSPERPVETGKKPQSPSLAASTGTEYVAYVDGDMKVMVKSK